MACEVCLQTNHWVRYRHVLCLAVLPLPVTAEWLTPFAKVSAAMRILLLLQPHMHLWHASFTIQQLRIKHKAAQAFMRQTRPSSICPQAGRWR
jgi:hypothetical protein